MKCLSKGIMINKDFYNQDVISIQQFTREDLETLFEYADRAKKHKDKKLELLKDKVVMLAFFEPSTRTRFSFEVAAKRLGADVVGFSGEEGTSISKGENFTDTIRMLDSYSNLIVIRHKLEGAAKYASEIAENPVINAGDGKQHHPTQAMIDLYTIREIFGTIDELTYAVVGDLRYGRASTSFIYGLLIYNPKKLYLVSPPNLGAREEVISYLKEKGVAFEEIRNLEEIIDEIDVLYTIRLQKERFPDITEYEKAKGSYKITLDLLKNAKKGLKIMHPLPKLDEIDKEIDSTEYAAYFQQAKNGVPVRMALLSLIFGVEL
ncbi:MULTISPECIES: aspartate carbamoyltransferase [Fervidicoccus]|jgi:aspartate carbamoyltransferase catalytic subunit|uniref:Aspartate carbamoyltransferase n=2 Tax=Fervidicoccus fontis TaxID=683846 RepID=A0A7C2ZRL4_9CREN|nr:aspartate carbamoyltransferase [Fervidicoccus fontis]PMB76762.1 MAG: aspartate carbamoyltransferase [Fervidicoccus fontis]HEW64332.1 aspartate carbamoyltransferase [Fervidicoccus fontis]